MLTTPSLVPEEAMSPATSKKKIKIIVESSLRKVVTRFIISLLQLVWASTTNVGCGGRFCEEIRGWDDQDDDQDENQPSMLVTCFYGPG